MAKVLILTGDAGESLEVMHPYQRLLEEGYEVEIAAPSKKKLQFGVLCHAPLVLGAAGVLEGRRTAAYPALEPDVEAFGAAFEDGAGVVDGQMVSTRAWPDHPAWMREFMRLLKERAPAEDAEHAASVT
jgi:putative intracellular protease/amidase